MAEMQSLSLTLAHTWSFHLRSAFSGGLRTPDSGLVTVTAVPVYDNYYGILSINGFRL